MGSSQCPRRNLVLFCAGVLLLGCSSDSSPDQAEKSSSSEKLQVTATSGMLTDIVRQVAGSYADVAGLMGEGVDPHLYKPTRNDVKRLMESDVIFYTGLKLEGRMQQTFEQAASRGLAVCPVGEVIPDSELLDADGHPDPHIWMDSLLWGRCVDRVADQLSEVDPDHAEDYRLNASATREQLDQLHRWASDAIATVPMNQRVLVTAHDAFGYFGRAYGLEIRSVQGISTESEAGIRDINDLVGFLVERRIEAIFVESSVSSENIRAVVEGAADQGVTVRIGGELFSDAMGSTGTYEGTYIGMIDHNVTTIVRALGGDVDAGGMQGKLSEHP